MRRERHEWSRSVRPGRPGARSFDPAGSAALHPDLFEHPVGLVDPSQRFDNTLAGNVDRPRDFVGINETVGQALDIAVEQDSDQLAFCIDRGAAGVAAMRVDGGYEVER